MGSACRAPSHLKTHSLVKLAFFSAKPYDWRSFEDLSSEVLQEDVFARLTTFPNVLTTGHQAFFFTREAMLRIAQTRLENLRAFEAGGSAPTN